MEPAVAMEVKKHKEFITAKKEKNVIKCLEIIKTVVETGAFGGN